MEKLFQSLSLAEFTQRFQTEQDCYDALIDQKWGDGYLCRKCKHTKYCKGIKAHDRQCTKCSYLESPTADTLFHHVKFSLLSAFKIVYFVATNKKGITSTELSRKLNIRQKTCWLFKQKVMQAMESNNVNPLEGEIELVHLTLGNQRRNKEVKEKLEKRKVVLAIEKKTKGAARVYGMVLKDDQEGNFKEFIETKLSADAHITTIDNVSFFKRNNIIFDDSKKGKFTVGKRVMHTFKSWLKGIHGRVELLQYYINEYCYRHNRHRMKGEIFDDLLKRMVRHKPAPYHVIIS